MERKIRKLRDVFDKYEVDALIISDIPNLEYIFEVKEPYCILVLFRDLTYVIYISELDYPRLVNIVPDKDSIVILSRRGYSPFSHRTVRPSELSQDLSNVLRGFSKLGYDRKIKPLKKLEDKKLEEVSEALINIRRSKDMEELEKIKKAVRIAEKALEEAAFFIKPDIKEVEIEAKIASIVYSLGAELAFKTIVASGPNSAIPHHVSSGRRLRRGDIVVIDLGARVSCYCSDITRTFVIGSPHPETRDIIYAVAEAQKKAISLIRSGASCREIDAATRQVLREYGLEQYFIHGLGHGLGIEVHESPSLSPDSEDLLKAGDVVTVEPGVYRVGLFGVRIEDDVYVTESGYLVLTSFPQVLI